MKKIFEPSSHYLYLSIFRVYIALHILQKIFFYVGSTDILFGVNSFAEKINDPFYSLFGFSANFMSIHYWYFLIAFAFFTIMVLFGIGKNISILAMYIFLEFFQRLNPLILNGGDNLLKFLVLYLVFADSFRHLTLFKSNKPFKNTATTNLVNNLAVYSIIFHLCLIYFVSGLHKINAKVWFSGVATYYTLSLERFLGTPWNKSIVQSGIFVTLSTYFVMLWEVFFPFLVSIKKLRFFTLVSGIFIHIGIFIFMMIYDFEILFIACYGFFYSDTELVAGYNKVKLFFKNAYNKFSYKKATAIALSKNSTD